MLKRLIEVALPLKEVSEQSAREKSIRHGHISTLHIWWARRPLAACRAAVFASLIPDPDDPQCPASFRSLVNELLNENEFRPKNAEGSATQDTPRNRCLEYIKHLVKWENSNKPHYIEPARKLIAAAHGILNPNSERNAPKVLDPFSGGGAIPLEALRLGCEAHAIDINPVAHLIQLCTLVFPQKFGRPNSRPLPEYIKRLIAHNNADRRAKGQEGADLFSRDDEMEASDDAIPEVEITEAEYLKNPLASDVLYWGRWIRAELDRSLGPLYAPKGTPTTPTAYLWARTVRCSNPTCQGVIPLIKQTWLCRKAKRQVAAKPVLHTETRICTFDVQEKAEHDFDPSVGFVRQGSVTCPYCGTVADSGYLQAESKNGRVGKQMMAVVESAPRKKGKIYRSVKPTDEELFQKSVQHVQEQVPADYLAEPLSDRQPRLMWVQL